MSEGRVVGRRFRFRAVAVLVPLFAAAAVAITPATPAHANTVWLVENFSTETLHLTANANSTVLATSTTGRRWSLLQNTGYATITLSSPSLGSVTVFLQEADSLCAYTDAAGASVAPSMAGLHCLFDSPPAGVASRVRIAQNSPQSTGVRQVGGSVYSVEGEWVLPDVTPTDCTGWPSWMEAGIGMYAGTRYYGIGTKSACGFDQRGEHLARFYYGKLGPNGITVSHHLTPGTRVRARILYLGGTSNKYLFTLDLVNAGVMTAHHAQWVEDDAKGGVQAREVTYGGSACSMSCKPGDGKPVAPSVAGWFVTGDRIEPLTWSEGDMAVKLRINEASPLTISHDASVRTDVLTATMNTVMHHGHLYRPNDVRDVSATTDGSLPYTALSISGRGVPSP